MWHSERIPQGLTTSGEPSPHRLGGLQEAERHVTVAIMLAKEVRTFAQRQEEETAQDCDPQAEETTTEEQA